MAKNKKTKKNLFWLLMLIILIIVGACSYFVLSLINDKKDETGTIEQVKQIEDNNSTKNEDIAEKVVEEKRVVQYEGDDANKNKSLTGVITYASVNGDKLTIRVSIDQYITSGQCELNLSKDGDTIYNSIANIIGNVSTSTCEGFDVPVVELGSGVMEININLNNGERSGLIRGEVNI